MERIDEVRLCQRRYGQKGSKISSETEGRPEINACSQIGCRSEVGDCEEITVGKRTCVRKLACIRKKNDQRR